MVCPYVELEVTSNYGFLRAASHPEELAAAAAEAGYEAIGIAERNSLAGIVRMHVATKAAGLRLAVGARLVPRDGPQETVCIDATGKTFDATSEATLGLANDDGYTLVYGMGDAINVIGKIDDHLLFKLGFDRTFIDGRVGIHAIDNEASHFLGVLQIYEVAQRHQATVNGHNLRGDDEHEG